MPGGGMSSGFNTTFNSGSNASFGGYEESVSDYTQQAGMFGSGAPSGGYYRPSC
jgi:hypothetical protein